MVDFQVLAVVEASQAQTVVAEYFLLILAWIVEAVDLTEEEVDLEATEDLLVATEAVSVATEAASVETEAASVETEEASAATEDPLVVEAAAEDSVDNEEVSGIIEDISNSFKLGGNLNNDS